MRRPAPRPLAFALAGLTAEVEPASVLAKVQRIWPDTVGGRVAAAARPTAERGGVLTVTCSDSVWSAELEMMGAQLAEQLNAALGQPLIARLRCRSG